MPRRSSPKTSSGRAAYIFEGVKALTNIKQHHIRVDSAEMSVEDDFIYGMVSNSISVGALKPLNRMVWCWMTACMRCCWSIR